MNPSPNQNFVATPLGVLLPLPLLLACQTGNLADLLTEYLARSTAFRFKHLPHKGITLHNIVRYNAYRAGEMILEVEGTRPWRPPKKRVPNSQVSQRTQNYLYNYRKC